TRSLDRLGMTGGARDDKWRSGRQVALGMTLMIRAPTEDWPGRTANEARKGPSNGMRALISVYDKTGAAEFAAGLADLGWEVVSTGGTLAALLAAGVPAVAVGEVTGFPEILDGRVKTLHPRIHGGILARRDMAAHADQLAAHGIAGIDLVA